MGKWFAKWYDPLMAPLEKRKFMQIRKSLLQKAEGEVLEIGSGTGINFPLYHPQVSHVIAIEPNPEMRKRSLKRKQQAAIPIDLKEAESERLPFMDQAFDTVIFTLVLCSVSDPAQALEEAKRVLKPGGKLLFFEHVRMESRFLGWLQDILTPAWKKVCDGCHLNRETKELIQAAGFKITEMQSDYNGLFISGMGVKEGITILPFP
jgi:ubiquinone/menaquinone biosynthesis C-methylase UbiE